MRQMVVIQVRKSLSMDPEHQTPPQATIPSQVELNPAFPYLLHPQIHHWSH